MVLKTFTIRKKQQDKFALKLRKEFENRVYESLEKRWPDEFQKLGEKQVRLRIHENFDRARSYGITRETGVLTFINLTFVRGENFHSAIWAQEILLNLDFSEKEKLSRLTERVNKDLEQRLKDLMETESR